MVNFLDAGVSYISPFAKTLSYLGAVIFVLFLAYLSTKFLSRLNISNVKNKNMRLVDKFFISSDRSILLFKVEKKFYLMASDKTGLKVLDILSEEDLPSYQMDEKADDTESSNYLKNKSSMFSELLKSKQKRK